MHKKIILFLIFFAKNFTIAASQSACDIDNKQEVISKTLLLHAFHIDTSCKEEIFENEPSKQENTLIFVEAESSAENSNTNRVIYGAVNSKETFTSQQKINNEKYKQEYCCCVIA